MASFSDEGRRKLVHEFYAAMNATCTYKKQRVTQERRMYLELMEVAKQIGGDDVLGIV